MAENIVMPKLGESIAEGTIVKWLKEVGQSVEKDENILLISTDKVEAEIPSPAPGILLSIAIKTGETVDVGTVLGQISQAGENSIETPDIPMTKKPTDPASTFKIPITPISKANTPKLPQAFLSPLVRRIMQEHSIHDNELEDLNGSGHNGRISKKDILEFVKKRDSATQSAAPTRPPSITIPPGKNELILNMSSMRKVIVQNMVTSRQTSAHVTTFFDVDYTKIDIIRREHKSRFFKEEGVPLTYTAFLAAAVCQTLKRHPYLNAEIREDQVVFKQDVHLGIAVSISEPEPGLMVPVIKNCDQINLRGVAKAISDLADKVRAKRILPDQLSGGTFTITNPGNHGGIIGTPIINQPQVAILGIGKIKKKPVVMQVDSSDVIGIRNTGIISLSFDHRLVDGATADIFMADLKRTLENWSSAP